MSKRISKKAPGFGMVLIGFLVFSWITPAEAASRVLRVGIYDFRPLVFVDTDGQARGFFIDILDQIAGKENWKITYVPGEWSQCLNRLDDGEIDLLVSIAHSEERAEKFDFTQQHLFVLWAEIYKREQEKIDSIFDLQGKTVSVVKGALSNSDLSTLLNEFGVSCTLIEKSSYSEILESMDQSRSDAGVFTSIYGMQIPESHQITRTRIVFAPAKLRFAVKKQTYPNILVVLDRYFAEFQADSNSVYYQAYDRWIEPVRVKTITPIWIYGMVAALGTSAILLIVFNIALKRKVAEKTKALSEEIAARSQAQKSLQESLEKYTVLFDVFPLGITVSDSSGKILETNSQAEVLLGLSKPEHERRSINGQEWEIIRPDGSTMPPQEYASVIALEEKRKIENCEMGIVRPDGRITWISVTAAPIPLDNHGVVVTYGDITELKASEEALRFNSWLLKAVQQSVIATDPDGRVIYWNSAAEKLYGWTSQEALNQPIINLIASPSAIGHANEIKERLQAGKCWAGEYLIRHRDGTEFPVEVFNSPIHDENGVFTGIIGVSTDIRDRKQAEEALKQSEERYRVLVENINDVIFEIDATGVATYISPTIEPMSGYSPAELIGHNLFGFVHPEDIGWLTERFREVLAGQTRSSQYRLLKKTGDFFWVRSSSRVIYDDGKPVGLRGALTDVSEMIRLEDELRQAHKLEAIGKLAGGIAHDFNNIMAIILGNTELALQDIPEWNPVHESLQEIRNASLRAKEIVRQILSFSRKTGADRKRIRLTPIIQDTLSLLRATIPSTIHIVANFDASDDTILANQTQISQILINLSNNAAYAMKDNGGRLFIGLNNVVVDTSHLANCPDLKPGHYIRLTVSDTGGGIDPQIIGSIFDPYFTTKAMGEGSGMGLAIVYGLVKTHEGAISVDNKPGVGTTFHVLFPVVECAISTEKKTDQTEQPSAHERILLIDDEPSIIKMVQKMLQSMGYHIECETDPIKALERFCAHPDHFDLVITDFTMPNIRGDQLAKKIHEISPEKPVILSTGHSEFVQQDSAEKLGISAYLMKPYKRETLLNTIRKVLDRV
ncbi:MAG: PAS domain S-box protein [Desulfatirhabdiaceae bacterium]